MSEIAISFEKDGINKTFILEISGYNSLLKVDGYYEYFEYLYECELCQEIDAVNPNNAIPIINKFLRGLKDNLTGEQKMRTLEKWLKIQPHISVNIEFYSSIKTNPPTGEILIFSKGGGKTYRYIIDVLWTNPMTVTGFHDIYLYEHENTEDPIVVPSMKYLLDATSCQWIDPTYKFEGIIFNGRFTMNKLLIIEVLPFFRQKITLVKVYFPSLFDGAKIT